MIRHAVLALSAALVLSGCVNQPAPSSYDIYVERFGPDGRTPCERYAYETGRHRFEFERTMSGIAWSAHNANLAARVAFERCTGRQGGRAARAPGP